jgi:hypothetical protein
VIAVGLCRAASDEHAIMATAQRLTAMDRMGGFLLATPHVVQERIPLPGPDEPECNHRKRSCRAVRL